MGSKIVAGRVIQEAYAGPSSVCFGPEVTHVICTEQTVKIKEKKM